MAFGQDACWDEVSCRQHFGRLVGCWVDQFSASYVLTCGAIDKMDVQSRREKGKARHTKGLIRIHHGADGFQIIWAPVGKPPVYTLTSCSDEYAIWRKVGDATSFNWTRQGHVTADGSEVKENVNAPAAVIVSCALSSTGDGDTLSDAESEYGLSDRQLAAVAGVPLNRWEWPLTKAEAHRMVQMCWEEDRHLEKLELLAEIRAQKQEIEDLRHTIRDQGQELEALRRQAASRIREGKDGPETMDAEIGQAPDHLARDSSGLAEEEKVLVKGVQIVSVAVPYTEDIVADPDVAATEDVRRNKRTQAKRERRKRQCKAKPVRSELPPASSNEAQEEAVRKLGVPGLGCRNIHRDEPPRGEGDAATASLLVCSPARGADWRPKLWGHKGSKSRHAPKQPKL